MKIGILGGGQLARMLALAGHNLGLDFIIADPSKLSCAVHLGEHLHGAYDDYDLLATLAAKADVITYEFENIPSRACQFLAKNSAVYPPVAALRIAQDRLLEKNFFHKLSIPCADFYPVTNAQDITTAADTVGLPAILKSRTMGYDGKGQVPIRSPAELAAAWQSMQGASAILEAWVPFDREVSIIAARNTSGDTAFYPLSENTHQQGILKVAKSSAGDPWQLQAQDYVVRLLDALGYVGVIALELFAVGNKLLANEFAPRVHNSGHWTIEGASTCQFENHLRAILGLPLGDTRGLGNAAMVNFIGKLPPSGRILSIPDVHLHLYNKSPRPGRKIAHATVCNTDLDQYQHSLQQLLAIA